MLVISEEQFFACFKIQFIGKREESMKVLNILKGALSGGIAALVTFLTIQTVSAYTNPLQHLSIPARSSQPLTVNSSTDDVLALMLDSDQMWNSLTAEYQLTTIDASSDQVQTEIQRFWLGKKGEWARVEIEGSTPITFVRNAAAIQQENRNQKVYFQTTVPDTFKYDGFNPRQWLLNTPGAVYLHPFGKALPTGYYDFLYPTGIAQSLITNRAIGLESVEIVGEEEVAGRTAIVISRMPKNHLYWVDAQTGIILRAQYIGESDSWQVQFEAQSITYDTKIPASVFQFAPAGDSKKVSPSEYYSQK